MDKLVQLRSQIAAAYSANNLDLADQLEEAYQDIYFEQRKTHTYFINKQSNRMPHMVL